ncbi:MAG: iron ABC transporter substrate-binding protein, partial [Burkholderiales bacterium PBB5]
MTRSFHPILPALTAGIAALCLVATPARAQAATEDTLNVLCSVQADWCSLIQTTFSRVAGIKVNVSVRSTGEALAQINAERANPKTDVWFGGTGDPHLAAAEQELTAVYKSPSLARLHPWAQAKRKLPVPRSWADLLRPEYKGEVQMANPASSGGAYTTVATLVQLMGEDAAWDYLARLHKNINTYPRSGEAPIKAVSRGESALAIGFIALAPGEKALGFPTEAITPAEGTGAEIGAMSLVKG